MSGNREIRWTFGVLVAALALAGALGGCASGSSTGDGGDGGGDGADGTGDFATDGEDADGGDVERDVDGDGGGDADTEGGDGGDVPDDAGDAGDGGPPPRVCVDERCGDGLDNDCDGEVDEGCFCMPGEVVGCFRGDPRRRGLGICRDGTMACEGVGEWGLWAPCEGDGVGGEEICDAAANDEDCDGAANDGCDCAAGDPDLACGTDVGECRSGIQRCLDGRWSECLGSLGPEPEDCNGLDDDCDRASDEGLLRLCGSSVGACRPGYETCRDAVWGACEGGNVPRDEVCDDLDNDCDTETDEDVVRACGATVGRCIAGTETCAAGEFGPCEGSVGPTGEACNDVDDDCDTETDEGLVRACGTSAGICVAGTETCVAGAGWGTCVGATWPGTELCDGTFDEDCDGAVDEGCACTGGATRPCGTDAGACVAGNQVCDSTGAWGPCTGSVGPAPEDCNGLDDDCDTATDEGGVCPMFPPTVACPGGRSTLVGTPTILAGSGSDPDGGPVTFAWTVFARPAGATADPSPPGAATTSFTPDVAGTYILRLCVTDDEVETTCCTVTVTATSSCTPPARPTVSTCPTSWDRRPIVEFDALPAGVVYTLFRDAEAVPYATVTAAGQNYHRPAAPLGTGTAPPGTTMTVQVRACRDADPSCCAATVSVTTALVDTCTTPVAPTPGNVVFSEYVINGDGPCPGLDCEAGEAIEITNLSHCPVTLGGHHFGYQNASAGGFRWMNFGPGDVIPPRGVYVAIRNQAGSACTYPFFGPDDPGLFGLRISTLAMEGSSLASGWFNNTGGGVSTLRVATGAWTSIIGGTTIELISPYLGSAPECSSIGFNAVDDCGAISGAATPTTVLTPNQLGRLWHPCDAVVAPNPPACR